MNDDKAFQDGWGPSAYDRDDWRAGDRDYSTEPREDPQDNRPNLFGRFIDRALGMGTPGEWAADFLATLILMGFFACLFAFAAVFTS